MQFIKLSSGVWLNLAHVHYIWVNPDGDVTISLGAGGFLKINKEEAMTLMEKVTKCSDAS
jgi:hypothetical protein